MVNSYNLYEKFEKQVEEGITTFTLDGAEFATV
jgi:hypothetical protein